MFISNSMRTGSSCFSDTPLLAAGFFIFNVAPTFSPLALELDQSQSRARGAWPGIDK